MKAMYLVKDENFDLRIDSQENFSFNTVMQIVI